MIDVVELLELSKTIATQVGSKLLDSFNQDHKTYVHSDDYPKEIKAMADTVLERDILDALSPIGLPILSEESGYISGNKESKYWFVIDPLDGTYNFVKGLGPSGISIALWQDREPIFGVIFNLSDRTLTWGGRNLGAYCDDREISVSDTKNIEQGSLCTGFPVRFDVTGENAMEDFWMSVNRLSKVRLLGSASVSLLHVANGSADVYAEKNIMLWDIAAGLAIIEGAGGRYFLNEANHEWSCNVCASNIHLILDDICDF